MGLVKEFKEFAMKGNVVDMAVGIVIGAAFGKIVSSLVDNIVMPVIGKITGGRSIENNFMIPLDGGTYETLAEARTAGAPVIGLGGFIQTMIDFLIIAAAIFVAIKVMNTVRSRFEEEKEDAPAKKPDDIVLLTEIRDALIKRP